MINILERASKIAQWVKELAAKFDNLSSNPKTHKEEGKDWFLQTVIWSPYMYITHTCTHIQRKPRGTVFHTALCMTTVTITPKLSIRYERVICINSKATSCARKSEQKGRMTFITAKVGLLTGYYSKGQQIVWKGHIEIVEDMGKGSRTVTKH